MARKRMIDPEFWSDEKIGTSWSHSARLFYIGLWSFADDEGRFKAHDDLLKSQIFPYDKSRINISALKKELDGKVQWYEFHGNQYGFCKNFKKHQKISHPTPSKLPVPPIIKEDSGKIPEDSGKSLSSLKEVSLKEVSISECKRTHLDFVLLTDGELEKLINLYGKPTIDTYIEKLNGGIGSKGYKYKSHYHTLISWMLKDGIKKLPVAAPKVKSGPLIKDFSEPKEEIPWLERPNNGKN